MIWETIPCLNSEWPDVLLPFRKIHRALGIVGRSLQVRENKAQKNPGIKAGIDFFSEL
jgi:hypothetical protein